MKENPMPQQRSLLARVSEDWWAVIVGFLILALAWAGILGKAKALINIPW
jgi:hypothetical protein